MILSVLARPSPPDVRTVVDELARQHGLRDGLSRREAWRRSEFVAADGPGGRWLISVLTQDRRTVTVGTARWGLVFVAAQVWAVPLRQSTSPSLVYGDSLSSWCKRVRFPAISRKK